MSKKKPKPDRPNLPSIHAEIRKMRRKEKTKRYIAAYFGFNSKVLQYVIDRWGLEEELVVPRLVAVR